MATFTNRASLSYNGVVVNSNIATGEIVDVLDANKRLVEGNYRPGDTLTYVIDLVNSGATTLTGITVSDDLGGYTGTAADTVYPLEYVTGSVLYTVNGEAATPPTVTAGPPLTFTGISIPADSNASIIYRARTTDFTPVTTGGSIVNTATVSGGGLTEPITAAATANIAEDASLSIIKTVTPASVPENGLVTYTFYIQNTGTLPATTGVVLTDIFDPILTNLTARQGDTVWAETTNYTYDEGTGTFTTVNNSITVPAATFEQDPATGAYTLVPGVTVVTIEGNI